MRRARVTQLRGSTCIGKIDRSNCVPLECGHGLNRNLTCFIRLVTDIPETSQASRGEIRPIFELWTSSLSSKSCFAHLECKVVPNPCAFQEMKSFRMRARDRLLEFTDSCSCCSGNQFVRPYMHLGGGKTSTAGTSRPFTTSGTLWPQCTSIAKGRMGAAEEGTYNYCDRKIEVVYQSIRMPSTYNNTCQWHYLSVLVMKIV